MNQPKIKFGKSQLQNAVPIVIKTIYRTIGFASVVVAIINTQLHIPAQIQVGIASGLLIGNQVLYAFCQFFGYEMPTNNNQPAAIQNNNIQPENGYL